MPIADRWTTTYGAVEERVMKGWRAPWVEVFAQAKG